MTEYLHRQVTGEALYGYGEALRFLTDRSGETPSPGDLFLVEATAEAPLEWLVMEEVGLGNWRVVAADLNPMAGSADVACAEEGWTGPVTLRSGVSTIVPSTALRSELRTGVVPPNALEEVHRKSRDIQAGELRGKPWEQETDAELEYQDWFSEVLQPAREALEQAWPVAAGPDLSVPHRESVSAGTPRRFHAWQMAAAILATAGLSFLLGQAWSTHSRSAPTTSLDPLLNPQLEWFQPATDTLRGDEREILLPPDAHWLTIVLETWNPTYYPAYEVELERNHDAKVVWATGQLQRQGASEVIFTLPASMLPEGAYIFRLSGQPAGAKVPLEEFAFTVRPAAVSRAD